jgi:hypothetical protein
MVSTEPELDAQGRPRHDDPRDVSRPPVPQRRRNWLPWIVAGLILLGLALFLPRAFSDGDEAAPAPAATAPEAEGSAATG